MVRWYTPNCIASVSNRKVDLLKRVLSHLISWPQLDLCHDPQNRSLCNHHQNRKSNAVQPHDRFQSGVRVVESLLHSNAVSWQRLSVIGHVQQWDKGVRAVRATVAPKRYRQRTRPRNSPSPLPGPEVTNLLPDR